MAKSVDSKRKVAIVGATGAVGDVLLRVLETRNFPVGELRALASERSVGTQVRFRGEPVTVELARPEAFDGVDFVFFAATGEVSKTLGPEVARRGGIGIDKSSTWRMHEDVPLVVPEVNGARLESQPALVANPNCSTIAIVMALAPLARVARLERVAVATYQTVSGGGAEALADLER